MDHPSRATLLHELDAQLGITAKLDERGHLVVTQQQWDAIGRGYRAGSLTVGLLDLIQDGPVTIEDEAKPRESGSTPK